MNAQRALYYLLSAAGRVHLVSQRVRDMIAQAIARFFTLVTIAKASS